MENEIDIYFARRMAVGTECAWLESTMSPTFVWNKILDNTESDILHLIFDPARALRELGLLLADGAPTVGGGKTFWAVSRIFLRKQL